MGRQYGRYLNIDSGSEIDNITARDGYIFSYSNNTSATSITGPGCGGTVKQVIIDSVFAWHDRRLAHKRLQCLCVVHGQLLKYRIRGYHDLCGNELFPYWEQPDFGNGRWIGLFQRHQNHKPIF